MPLLCAAQHRKNLSWYPALNICHKIASAIKCRLYDDSLHLHTHSEHELLKLFENVTCVWFFETQCTDMSRQLDIMSCCTCKLLDKPEVDGQF